MLLSGSCLFHHSLYFSTSLYLIHHSLFWSIICPDIQVKRVLCGQIGVYESILQIHEANSFFFFIKKGALLFYTFCTRYCITISFFIEFLTSLNIKAPPNWNPVSMCFWRYSWCNYFCKKSCMINHLNGIQIRRYMFIPFKMEC